MRELTFGSDIIMVFQFTFAFLIHVSLLCILLNWHIAVISKPWPAGQKLPAKHSNVVLENQKRIKKLTCFLFPICILSFFIKISVPAKSNFRQTRTTYKQRNYTLK